MLEQCAKEILRDQEEMIRKEKQATLVQLAGGLGHELRNSLGAIKYAAYFLRVALEKPHQEVNEALEILEGQVSISERIIHNLIWFARPRPPIRHRVNLNDITEEALSHVPISGNILVVSQLDESSPTILADPDQLCQVFTNVILNAIQAMPEGGQLIIESGISGDGLVTVSLKDTGPGIPPENMRKIFEPFFTTKSKGIGLGLSITKILLESHGGTCEVKSDKGNGCDFIINLPIEKEESN